MSTFTDKIKQFASTRKWQVEIRSESSCNIQFTFSNEPFSDMLTYIRAITDSSSVQFMLTPGAYSVTEMSNFPQDLSNTLLYRNSTSKGFWSILESKTKIGAQYFPSYARVIEISNLDIDAFNEIMDDIVSEFEHLD